MPALELTADDHVARRIDAVDLKHRFGDVEADCGDRLHAWLPKTATAPTAITSWALTCRWGSRPQHQQRTLYGLRGPVLGLGERVTKGAPCPASVSKECIERML